MIAWLQRILGLPRLTALTAILSFIAFFVGMPLIGPAIEQVLQFMLPSDAYLMRSLVLWVIAICTAVAAVVSHKVSKTFLMDEKRAYRNPVPAKRLVILSSDKGPSADMVEEWLTIEDRRQLFRAITSAVHKRQLAPWIELLFRAIEWHRPRLEELVLVVTRDGLARDSVQLDHLTRLLEHYLSLRRGSESLAELCVKEVPNSVGFEETRVVVESIKRGIEPEDIIFNLTPGTKSMSVGMVLACLDSRYNLEYFMQMNPTLRKAAVSLARTREASPPLDDLKDAMEPEAVGWGLLPIEREMHESLDDAGVLPILIDVDTRVILSNMDS